MLIAAPYVGHAANENDRKDSRYWYLQVQAGAAYTLGEGNFGDLVSPAVALSAGYHFSPVWGLRFGFSGWEAHGAWVSPYSPYGYNFLQGNVEATLDLANLFGRYNPTRTVNPYLFAGIGLNYAFNNDEAVAINNAGYTLDNLWTDSKAFAVGRFGLGVNFRVSKRVQLGLEVNANILSDKFNSKKAENVDWHFNAMAGLTARPLLRWQLPHRLLLPHRLRNPNRSLLLRSRHPHRLLLPSRRFSRFRRISSSRSARLRSRLKDRQRSTIWSSI